MESTWHPLIDPLRTLDHYAANGYFSVPSNTFAVRSKIKPQWVKGVTRWESTFSPETAPTAVMQNPTPFGFISKVAFQNLDPINYNDIPRSGNMPSLVSGPSDPGMAVDAATPATQSTPNALGFLDQSGEDPTSHPLHDMWKDTVGGGPGGPADTNTSGWNVWTGNNLAGIDPATEGAINDAEKVGPGADTVGQLRGVASGFAGQVQMAAALHQFKVQPYDGVQERFVPHQGILQPIKEQDPAFYGAMQKHQGKARSRLNRQPYARNIGDTGVTPGLYDGIVQMPNPPDASGGSAHQLAQTATKSRMNMVGHGSVQHAARRAMRAR